MNWSTEQRRVLGLLGHDLMVQGRPWPASAGARSEGASVVAAAAQVPAVSAAQASRLLEALRRAAGGADVATLVGDVEQLRRQPALKRALWPRLRALRRSH